MRKSIAVTILLLIVALAGGYLAWKYTFRETDLNVSARKADVHIDARDLILAYESDENAANELYLDKVLLVTGTVESVSEDDVGISVYLKGANDLSGVICGFDKTTNVKSLEKGSVVNIKGICTGYLIDVVMNRCYLVD